MAPGPCASPLPQLQGRPMATDGGLETDLIFHHGADLPHFAAFPLLESDRGRALPAARHVAALWGADQVRAAADHDHRR